MFSQQLHYQNHLRLHTTDEKNPYSCNICRKSFTVPARLTRHYRTHTGEKPYQCEFCSKSFSVKENLSVHRRIHTKERPYKCDVCDSAFEHSGKLHRHMRIHTGERPHKCLICNKTFIQSGQLVIHMRTHTGEKPYICKSCGKGFTCSKQLKVHTRTHTGEKPYACDICGKSFGYNHVLKLHQVAHYGEKCYKCTICYETFNSKKLMESHIKNHSESSNADFSSKNELQLKNSDARNRLLLCDYMNDYEIPVSEKELFNCAMVNNSQGSLKIQTQIDKTEGMNISKMISKPHCIVLNTNSHSTELLENIRINETSTRRMSINSSSTQQHTLTDCSMDNSCLYEIQNNDFFAKTCLKTICLTRRNFMHNMDDNFDQVKEEQRINSRKIESSGAFNAKYHAEFDNQLYRDSFNFVIPNKRNNYSLPPRKRCKMILESMNTENLKSQSAARYHSVIRFARSEITKSIDDNKNCLNS
ncbi:zinc finger protein 271 isoform X1 [Nasonia vitripennis]|uniref:C2H2-type domain-containing protein n=1 Tax=Nasonia vitripennis TaxID=7425 RepID=A0A7M7T898_NASVI|nr:zinc finger protein 271 isoform X1 [Nasonia vitripennis]